jgi:hypothetical protein
LEQTINRLLDEWFYTVVVEATGDESKSQRGASRKAGPTLDQQWPGSPFVSEFQSIKNMLFLGKCDTCLLSFNILRIVESQGQHFPQSLPRCQLPPWFHDRDRVPESRITAGDGRQPLNRTDGEVTVEKVEEHGLKY